ncbi:hypothetical protein J7S19_01695 [Corynebacterium pyruviciproducens]|uniref:hypothetical protein n=1 Tax=Corynebacterium pyruviciproducens TaxID=598660 RepID=UPI002453B694|nr:hypothetical protein [Corynebacterium pyruviciproducens]MDH4657342.1 hypothetical protein [Corynebacterium pyruviciproducens]
MNDFIETSVREQTLHAAATDLRTQFQQLQTIRWTKPKIKLARKMRPTFGPQSPTPDNDWSLNLEDCLVHERLDEQIPGGLAVMVDDAISYTGATMPPEPTGIVLCDLVEQNAWEIAERFPAAPDLADLMVQQAAYIATRIRKRYPQLVTDQPSVLTRRMQATEIVRQLSVRGTATTPDTVRGWARHGRISAEELPNGHKGYLLAECLTVVTKITRE